jgi:hypothetical protein
MTAISIHDPEDYALRQVLLIQGLAQGIVKAGADLKPAYNLVGQLYHKKGGMGDWIMLSVPNALVRGVYAAMDEPGIELPPSGPEERLDAHISVIRPDELAALGGPEKITERGKQFKYRIGGLVSTAPAGWPDMSHVWMLRVHSPELQALRRSYGLSSLPKNGEFDFHISVAVRRKGVLGRNDKQKT